MQNLFFWSGAHTPSEVLYALRRHGCLIDVTLAQVIKELHYDPSKDMFLYEPVKAQFCGEECYQHVEVTADGYLYVFMPDYCNRILALNIKLLKMKLDEVIENFKRVGFERLRFVCIQDHKKPVASEKPCGLMNGAEEAARKQQLETMKRLLNTKVGEPTEEETLVVNPSEADRVTDGPVGYVDEEKYAELSKAYDEMCQIYCDVCAEREAARTERDRALYTCNQLREANAELNAKLQCPTEDKYKKLYEEKTQECADALETAAKWQQAYVNLQQKINQLVK